MQAEGENLDPWNLTETGVSPLLARRTPQLPLSLWNANCKFEGRESEPDTTGKTESHHPRCSPRKRNSDALGGIGNYAQETDTPTRKRIKKKGTAKPVKKTRRRGTSTVGGAGAQKGGTSSKKKSNDQGPAQFIA